MSNRMLIRYGGVAALSLPPGKLEDGGSCEFASAECLKECFEMKDRNSWQDRCLENVHQKFTIELYQQFIKDLKIIGSNQIFWFAAGDCPVKQTEKLSHVAQWLADDGIWQGGFTRNKRFWRALNQLPRTKIAFSMEDPIKAQKLSLEGLVAWPDYKTEKTFLIEKGQSIYFCGGGWGGSTDPLGLPSCGSYMMEDSKGEPFEADCNQCQKNDRGCWT